MDVTDPRAWLSRLLPRLVEKQRRIAGWQAYYDGDQELPLGAVRQELAHEFPEFTRLARNNLVPIPVNALAERIDVEGIRVNGAANDAAAALWARNNLDLYMPSATLTSLIASCAYTMVWDDDRRGARITVEDPRQVIHQTVPGEPDRTMAALKAWWDDVVEEARVDIYLPDGRYSFRADSTDGTLPDAKSDRWEPRDVDGAPEDGPAHFLPNPDAIVGIVPVTPLVNMPDLLGEGRSEVAALIDIQDRINKTAFDRLVAQEFTAFPQRWAIGVEDIDSETNQKVERFKAAISQMWTSENEGAKFGQLPGQDLRPYLDSIEQDLVQAARISGVPPYYLDAKGQFPSGDAIGLSETGLNGRARRRHASLGVGLERTLRIAFAVAGLVDVDGSPLADADISIRWADPETRSFGALADAGQKLHAMGFPLGFIAAFIGLSDDEIVALKRMIAEDGLLAGLDLNRDDDLPAIAAVAA